MKISLGPILGFRGVTTSGWNVSVLIVTDILSNPPELILQSGSPKDYPRLDLTAGRCDSIAPPNCCKLPRNYRAGRFIRSAPKGIVPPR